MDDGMGTIQRRARIAVLLLGATLLASRAGAQAAQHADTVYFEFQVETPVEPLPGPRPVYPPALSAAHITGNVLVQFVVDTLGRPEVETFKVLSTTNAPFADAVRDVLPTMRFRPASIHRRLVRQLVQQPFVFTLD
jgi:TonB family protein